MAIREPSPIILLVEDSADTIYLIRFSLLKAGFSNKVLEAHNGEEAIDYLLGRGSFGNRLEYPLPDVIFLDLKMPRMDGFEFLRWLRKWPPGRIMPVVVMTSSDFPADLRAAYDSGANSYLVKSGDPAELLAQMNAIGSLWLNGAARLPGLRNDSWPA